VVDVKIEMGARIRGAGVNMNKAADKSLTTKMLQYSAMKISANLPPPYSTLNPETSSDSPSAKSNGARFVSAKRVINQAINKGGMMIIRGVEWLAKGVLKLKDINRVKADKRRRAIEISYEIV